MKQAINLERRNILGKWPDKQIYISVESFQNDFMYAFVYICVKKIELLIVLLII